MLVSLRGPSTLRDFLPERGGLETGDSSAAVDLLRIPRMPGDIVIPVSVDGGPSDFDNDLRQGAGG